MQLTLAIHPVADIRFGETTRLDGTSLIVDKDQLRNLILEDETLEDVGFELVRPGENCRIGPVFDIVEPRAKALESSPDFPGILGPPLTAGMGTTHVLEGTAVTVIRERPPGEGANATGSVLEMSGSASEGTKYASLQHLVVIPHTRAGMAIHAQEKAYRLAGLKVSVYVAQAALKRTPATTQTFEPVGPAEPGREGLPRIAYVGQIFSRQRKPQIDEQIFYGANTDGMLPALLHPDEWLDGAIVPSYYTSMGGTETYFYQNHPVIMELYGRHQLRALNFVGTVATIAGNDHFDRERSCRAAAHLVKWALKADAAVLTKTGGGVPHADMAETARLLENMGIRTAVIVSDLSRDRRVESALLFNHPEVNAIVYCGGYGSTKTLPPVERVIAAGPEMAKLLAGPLQIGITSLVGVVNQQGASRLRAVVY
jgi:sarcosine reductase